MTTVLETLDKGTAYLAKKGIGEARRNMQMLVAHQLGCTRMDLYLRFDEPLEEKDLVPLRELLKKRGEGVPIQHLVGTVLFHRRDFKCDGRGLIPRPETEELAEWLLKHAAPGLPAQPRILDMGCGSGVLGLTLAAEIPAAEVVLADLSPEALALSRENATELGVANARFVESDLFSALGGESFDLIVANLPYVPERDRGTLGPELAHDPALALFGGPDGMDVIRRFVPEAAARLHPGGWLALEIGIDQAAESESLLHAAGLAEVLTIKDLSGVARFPVARRA